MQQYLAKTLFGLEDVLAQELKELGATDIVPGARHVTFKGDKRLLYRANYELRTAIRILQPIYSFKTKHENHFYAKMYEFDWAKYFDVDQTFAIDGVTQSKYMTHSKYVALKAKDSIVDQFRSRFRERPSIDVQDPDIRFNVHISRENLCTVSIDTSGDSLHKRGYRRDTVEAPINEILAAGLVLLSDWKRDRAFLDPMCGSGTIAIEAAMLAKNMPPQKQRKIPFGFVKRKDFDADLWDEVKREADAKISDFEHDVLGSDKDFDAVSISRFNAGYAEVDDVVTFSRRDFKLAKAPAESGVLIFNPPYDERLGVADVTAFYKAIGDALKKNWTGWEAWIISSNIGALKRLGLRASSRKNLFNGKLECKLMQFEMYDGTRKVKKEEGEKKVVEFKRIVKKGEQGEVKKER